MMNQTEKIPFHREKGQLNGLQDLAQKKLSICSYIHGICSPVWNNEYVIWFARLFSRQCSQACNQCFSDPDHGMYILYSIFW